jgi:hypothetical protein
MRCLAAPAAAAAAAAAAAPQRRSARRAAALSRPPARCAHAPHAPHAPPPPPPPPHAPPRCHTRRRRGGALRAAPPDADARPSLTRTGGGEGEASTSASGAEADRSRADTALGRTLLVLVAASYGSMTVALRYVFLLPGPPVRARASRRIAAHRGARSSRH